ncbi:MAG: ABC transporter permease [Pseudomonadales bacterium]|nr:ABC transporter permease [Pseudomonadales bacterium]
MDRVLNHWAAFPTLFRGEVRRFMRIWLETLVPSAISLTLYLIIFGSLIGERIGPVQGITYREFIVPGLIMLTVIMNAYENVTFSVYMAKFEHCIEEILVAPIPDYVLLAGYIGGGVIRGLVVGLMALSICVGFNAVQMVNPWIVLLTVIMSSVIFSMAGFINALFANNFDDVSIIPIFVLTPLIYLGGVFYSIELLPEVWRNLSLLNPMLYIINTARYGFTGIIEINLNLAFAMMSGFIVILFCACLWLLRRGVGLRG